MSLVSTHSAGSDLDIFYSLIKFLPILVLLLIVSLVKFVERGGAEVKVIFSAAIKEDGVVVVPLLSFLMDSPQKAFSIHDCNTAIPQHSVNVLHLTLNFKCGRRFLF